VGARHVSPRGGNGERSRRRSGVTGYGRIGAPTSGTVERMESPKKIVLNAWREFASHDHDRVAQCFTPDAEWLAPAGNAAARAVGSHHLVGRERIARFIADEFPELFGTDITLELGGVVAEGDTVVVEHRMRATLPGGRPYDVEYCFVLELCDGLIHRVREYLDTRRGLEMFDAPVSSPIVVRR
jgi:ketosteroid isomerase-like protein